MRISAFMSFETCEKKNITFDIVSPDMYTNALLLYCQDTVQ